MNQKNTEVKKKANRKKAKVNLIFTLLFLSSILLFSSISSNSTGAQAEIYEVNPTEIKRKIKTGDFETIPIIITNKQPSTISISFNIDDDLIDILKLEETTTTIEADSQKSIQATIFGGNTTSYVGDLIVSGPNVIQIPVNITVTELDAPQVEALLIDIEPITEKANIGDLFKFKVGVTNLLTDMSYNLSLYYSIDKMVTEGSYTFEKSFFEESEIVELTTSLSLVKEFQMPEFIRPGIYVINVRAEFLGLESSASRTFRVVEPFWDHVILGILPVRWVIFTCFFLILAIIATIIYLKRKAKKKRYVVKVDYNLLPKAGPRAAYIGMIAETNKKAYFELEQLTTHTLIAGSTGGGKTVSAEVLVEEALIKGVSVIVFDPTAQWTGFLRKNTDKKMFGFYPRFGLKKTDARAFNGNVRQILDAREIIEVEKYMKPGEINVFSITKLDPEDADIIVANTIRAFFKANLPESRELKTLIIFDEVHRLLPKFGGSGQGFIQIERAAREFRKWGVGLFLISQVLSDFVGETKANINTEIQMRTRDQGDLDRIKNKYGGYMLQSLLKSSTGTGMMENAAYNKGNPYFVSFRPLFHEHARLTDKELENYNKYNEMIDDLDFQIEELEKKGIDVFDLKLELKMALDKVKSGSFNMVDIYLEGLKPRITDQFKKLGITQKKREKKLVSEDELKAEFLKAQKEREKYDSAEGSGAGGGGGSKPNAKVNVPPLKLKNGTEVKKPMELLDAINAMDDATLAAHFNAEKNDFADWYKGIDEKVAEKLKEAKSKDDILGILDKAVYG